IYILLLSNLGGCTGSVTISQTSGPATLIRKNYSTCGVIASTANSVCPGNGNNIQLTATTTAGGPTPTYTWTGPNGYSGTGSPVTIPNANASMAGTYTVTATTAGGTPCSASTVVIINQIPTINPSVNGSVYSGTPVNVCSGSPVNFNAVLPAGATGFWQNNIGGFLSFQPTATIASATTASGVFGGTGNYTFTALLAASSFGAPQCQVVQPVAIVVNPTPTVSSTSSQTYCSGSTVPAINFTGSQPNATYNWTNSQPSIGLLSTNGTAGIPSFIATNSTGSPITASISVVPTLGNCNGPANVFNIIVNPTPAPTINTSIPLNSVYCEGEIVPSITWNTSVPTATVSWTNNNTASGLLLAAGTGTIQSFTTSQVTSQIVSTITATPSAGVCVGTPVVLTLTVNNTPSATITDIAPLCSNAGLQTLVAATAGGVWSGAGVDANTGVFDPLTAGAGPHIISYALNLPNQCPQSDNTQIQVINVPVVNAGPNQSVCQGQTITLNGSFTNSSTGSEVISWSPIINLTGASTLSPTYTANSTQTYTLTVTSGICSATDNVEITMNSQSNANIDPLGPLCSDAAPVVLTAAQSGGTWSGSAGIVNSSSGEFDPSLAVPGPQNITYSISGVCPDVDTYSFVVNEVFDGTITPVQPICQADLPIVLTAASAGGTWTGTGINSSTSGSFGSSSLAASTYSVTYTTAGSCPRIFNTSIVVNANFDPTISNVLPLCANSAPFNLVAADPGGTWAGSGITDQINGTFDPAAVINGPQTIITYSIPGACPSSDTQAITVNPVFDGTITPVEPICQADLPIVLTAASTGGTWTGAGINSPTSGSFGSSTLSANSYTITYTPQGNCSQASTTTIVVNANVDATISSVSDVCNNAPAFNMVAADVGGTWSGPTGISATGTFTPNSVTPGPYTITYSIGGACPDSDTETFNVLQVPDGTITSTGPFCQADLPVTLTAASTGGTWNGTGLTNAVSGTFGSSILPAGTYNISYTTSGQCSQVFNQTIQVNANLDPTIAPVGPFCADALPISLTAASAGGVWSGTGAITLNGQISPSALGAGTYTFTYDIDNNGCLSSDNVEVVINALPSPSFSASSTTGCSPLSVTFTNTSSPLGSNCVWYVDGNAVGSGNVYSDVFQGNSCSDVGLMVINAAGCSATATQNDIVCVVSNPSASFSWEPIEPIIGTSVLFDNASLGGASFDWTINGISFTSEDVNFQLPDNLDETFEACLTVTGATGCMDAQCYTVSLSKTSFVYVPNSFTPDGDGKNDVFAPVITGLTSSSRYTFSVYNRWGDLIFETKDPDEAWVGDVNNGSHFAEDGAYMYLLKIQFRPGEEPFKRMGTVVLVR
ncbi:MAG: hypothetical protein RL664_889, partial [Bacteroidota bacterium]